MINTHFYVSLYTSRRPGTCGRVSCRLPALTGAAPGPRHNPPPPPSPQVSFIGSPKHIRSPYLRSKLSEVLHAWLPPQGGAGAPSFRRG